MYSLSFPSFKRTLPSVLAVGFLLSGCGGSSTAPPPTPVPTPTPAPAPAYVITLMAPTFLLTGDVSPVHDPSITYQGGNWYSLTTDPGGTTSNFLPIRSSPDKLHWTETGHVFDTIPPFIQQYFAPTVLTSLWAPDISFYNGLYHLYYVGSEFGTNTSLIALATTPTLDPADPAYHWTSQGIVLASHTGDIFNAIDPTILVDTDAMGNLTHVWLTFGSYFGGIFQRELDPATGLLSSTNTAQVSLATRPAVANNPIEGTSLVKHNGFYYLFASFDYCCQATPSQDNYKIAVGRATSPQGPFLDMSGASMLQGGGTILLQSGPQWTAPGGATVLVDPVHGNLIAYHALNSSANYADVLFVNSVSWPNDWPVIVQ